MITVYVWSPSDGYGHASMLIDGGQPQGRVYVSYWPESNDHQLNWFPPGGCGVRNYNAPAVRNRTYEQDMLGERDRSTDPPRLPTYTLRIQGLDETSAKRWWAERQRTWPRWDATSNNCATTVAAALRAAGADHYCNRGVITYWYSHNRYWTPMNIVNYVHEIWSGMYEHLLEPSSCWPTPLCNLLR